VTDSFRSLQAVVTGSSSGIGRQIALALARSAQRERSAQRDAGHEARIPDSGDDGDAAADRIPAKTAARMPARIVVHYRRNRGGAETTAEQIAACGVQPTLVAADLRQPDQRRHLVDRAWEILDQPTTWVNNAGADVLTGSAAAWSFAEKLRVLMETDVLGTIDVTRQVVARWQTADRPDADVSRTSPPSIVFIGWDQAPEGFNGDAGQMFGPVKAAVMAYANSLAQEVAPAIRVNTVAPGWIQTAWGESTDDYWNQRAMGESLMRRWGRPADVAAAVCYLADPANTFIHGQTIAVNGGFRRSQL